MKRRVSVRRRLQNENAFVRLHPATVQSLWREALLGQDHDDTSTSTLLWSITQEKGQSAQVTSGIEFLPLELTTTQEDATTTIYVSYNGGDLDTGMYVCDMLWIVCAHSRVVGGWVVLFTNERISIYLVS